RREARAGERVGARIYGNIERIRSLTPHRRPMEQHRDERITCVGCGNSFLSPAAEAAHYEERGLAAPPKRCRECRRARKEQRERGEPLRGGYQRPAGGNFGSRGDSRGNGGMPIDTGN